MVVSNETLITAAREWLAELSFADLEPEEFESMPEDAIRRGVAKHYDGGWAAFVTTVQDECNATA